MMRLFRNIDTEGSDWYSCAKHDRIVVEAENWGRSVPILTTHSADELTSFKYYIMHSFQAHPHFSIPNIQVHW